MLKHTARRGKNAGKQFYGCPNWKTTCKGVTIDVGESKNSEQTASNQLEFDDTNTPSINGPSPGVNQSRRSSLPAKVEARARHEDLQAHFIEAIALPRPLLEEANQNSRLRESLMRDAKWRMDYPIESEHVTDEDTRSVLLIAQKILLRGNLTLISPRLEQKLESFFGPDEKQVNKLDFAQTRLSLSRPYSGELQQFDGYGSEESFYREILPKIIGPNFQRFVVPQISIGSLINASKEESHLYSQRVDFYINTGDTRCVIEIDGPEHEQDRDYDEKRDTLLSENRIPVFRLTNQEIKTGSGVNIDKIFALFEGAKPHLFEGATREEKFVIGCKLAHQIQIAVLESILRGHLPVKRNSTLLLNDSGLLLSKGEAKAVAIVAIGDLQELLNKLCKVYDLEELSTIKLALFSEADDSSYANYDIAISFNDTLNVSVPTIHIQDITFHHSVAYEEQPIEPMRAVNTDADLLVYFLTYIFRHPEFNEGQHEAISRAMSGQDTIVLLPTGAGKSVAYQLTSLLMPGVMIVVSPLIALINDQLDNLRKTGIDRVISITSQTRDVTERERAYDAFEQAQFLFCYVAPERFQMDEFRTAIQALKQCTPVSVIAVDEAHCVSEWGHDFRTSYLNIGRISRDTCSAKGFTPPLLALTGTASHAVLRDIQRELNIDDFEAIITPSTFDRKEIEFLVTTAKPDEKFETLKSILQRVLPAKFNQNQSTFFTVRGKKTHCGIVFCPHVNWKLGILEFADRIHDELGVDAKVYAGKAPKKIPPSRWEEIKLDSAQGFKNNRYPLLVSTKAFGMGIDKPNVRYTTHISLPHSVEQYYQEAGRAGRDRQPALSVLIYTSLDKKRTDRLLSPETSPEEVAKEVENTKWKDKDDIMHALFFHVGSFQGKKPERDLYRDFISRADSLKERSEFPYSVSKRADLNQTEKVLHRLCILGVISDYTIKYSRLEFRVCSTGADNTDILTDYLKYVGGYNRARIPNESSKLALHLSEPKEVFMEKAYETLIDFIYDTIERGRRRALREMASLAEDCSAVKDQSTAVREKILSYLQTSFSEEIEDLLKEVGGLEKLKKLILGSTEPETGMLIGGIQSPLQAKEIRGQAARYLESYPTHTGILLLRGFSELLCADANAERACENILAGLKYAHEWQLSKQQVYDGISHLLGALANASHEQYSYIAMRVLEVEFDLDFVRSLFEQNQIQSPMVASIAQMLLAKNVMQSMHFAQQR